jgi:uncharacterized membrane protein
MQWVRRQLWPLLYLVWVIPFLVAIEAATPPWQNSDEPLHMARAVQIAHGGLVGYRAWTTSGGMSDRAIYDAYRPVAHVAMHADQTPTSAEIERADQVPWSATQQYTSFPNTAQYPPMFYLPDAAAYWFGRAAGLSIGCTLHIARLANATLFAVAAALSLSISRRARFPLAAILMLPMTLSLACSAAQDSLMIAATALAVAMLDQLADSQKVPTRVQAASIVVSLAAVAMARPPYAGFLLLLLSLAPTIGYNVGCAARPPQRTLLARPWSGWVLLGFTGSIVLVWCILVAVHTSVKLGGSDIDKQLAYLHAHPGRIPYIIVATIASFTRDYWTQFIGTLGWTDTVLPFWYTLFATAVAAVAALAGTNGPALRIRLVWCGIGFATAAIFVLQYLTWTWPGQPVVTGVLGRYFIPPAMIAALGLPHLKWRRQRMHDAAVAALLALALVTPPVTLHALYHRYYKPGFSAKS